jgi:hypothetical protein
VLEHLGLQILEHHVSILQLLVGGHILCVRQLSIECHDGPECLTFGNETKFARRKVVILTMTVHLGLLDGLKSFLEQILNTQLHHHAPNVLPVVKDPGILLLLLCAVEEAPHETDHDVLKDPFEHLPDNPVVLILEIPRIDL